MAVADITKSIPHIIEDFVGVETASNTTKIKPIFRSESGTPTNPADFTAVANASALTTATVTVTGVAVGDLVLGWGVVSGLAANQYVVAAYVSATDTVTIVIGNALNSTVTTTAVVVNLLMCAPPLRAARPIGASRGPVNRSAALGAGARFFLCFTLDACSAPRLVSLATAALWPRERDEKGLRGPTSRRSRAKTCP